MPDVAAILKPSAVRSFARVTTIGRLSLSLTERNAVPRSDSVTPAPNSALAYASPKLRELPITSPVDFISGPRTLSSRGKRLKGNTGALTKYSCTNGSCVSPSSRKVIPAIAFAASLAN